MIDVFQVCLVAGVAVLALQILLNLVGIGVGSVLDVELADGHVELDGAGHELTHDAHTGDALGLLSVRAIAAGIAIFGVAGLGLTPMLPEWAAAVIALVPAYAAAYATAWLTRRMLGMQTSGTLRLADTVGREATVYLTIPPDSVGGERHGLIHVLLQGRTAELRAVTREAQSLPSGATVVVLSVSTDGETAEVVNASTFEEMIHDDTR